MMLELNKIYNMDCLEGINLLDDNSIDLVVTSPPYYNAKEYSHWNTLEDYENWLYNIFSLLLPKIKKGRMICVNLSVVIEPRKSRQTESKRLALPFHFISIMERIGYKFLEDIIWVKPDGASKNRNGGFFRKRQPIQYKPNIVNEYIFVFQTPTKTLIDSILKTYKGEIKEQSLVKGKYERTNVWYINPETKSKHPAPFPKTLSDNLIKYYSYINDVILDIFNGSGTTCLSAKELNRNYIGFEINKEYCEIAESRLK